MLFMPDDALAHAPHDEVRTILLSPAYAHDGIVFAIIRWNILRSVDFGHTWHRLTRGLGPYSFLDLAISPAFEVDRRVFVASDGGGIFQSSDAGLSWTRSDRGLADPRIGCLAISPTFETDRRLVAVGSTGQLYATHDGGENWRRVFPDSESVSVAALIDDAVVVGTCAGGVYRSDADKANWRRLASLPDAGPITCLASLQPSSSPTLLVGSKNGVAAVTRVREIYRVRPIGLAGRHVTSLAVARDCHERAIVFATTWREAVFRSEDVGKSWTKHGSGLTTNHQADEPAFRCPQFRGLTISSEYAVDQTVFLGGFDGVFKSEDGGRSWREMRAALPIGLIVGLDLASADAKHLRVAVSTYVAGVYSQDADGPWEIHGRGLERGRLFDIAFSPDYPSDHTVFTVSGWMLFRSTDGGHRWEGIPLIRSSRALPGLRSRFYWVLRPIIGGLAGRLGRQRLLTLRRWLRPMRLPVGIRQPGFGAVLAISPEFATDQTVFVGGSQGVLRSRAGGLSLQYVLGPTATPVRSLVVSPDFRNDQAVFVAFDDSLYRSVDAGTTWEVCRTGPELYAARLAISPAYEQDRTLFMGSISGLWRSRDGGTLWQRLPIAALGENTAIDGLAVSPSFRRDRELVVHVCGIGLFRSEDGGNSFNSIGFEHMKPSPAFSHMTGFPDRTSLIRYSPNYDKDRTLYASSMEHLLKSSDGGATWRVLKRPVRFENACGQVFFRGAWRLSRDARFSALDASVSSRPGDVAVMEFVGQEVRWIGVQGPGQGIANVLIDGNHVAIVDQYARTPAFSVASFVASDLSYGPHCIAVEVCGERNTRSTGRLITIDAFDVT
jgi:photosystem II stability/assembly factor-like uncharacterized protein